MSILAGTFYTLGYRLLQVLLGSESSKGEEIQGRSIDSAPILTAIVIIDGVFTLAYLRSEYSEILNEIVVGLVIDRSFNVPFLKKNDPSNVNNAIMMKDIKKAVDNSYQRQSSGPTIGTKMENTEEKFVPIIFDKKDNKKIAATTPPVTSSSSPTSNSSWSFSSFLKKFEM